MDRDVGASSQGLRGASGAPARHADLSPCGVLCRKGLWAGWLESYFVVLPVYSRCCAERCPGPVARPPAVHPLTPTPRVPWVQFHATPSICALGLHPLSLPFCHSCKIGCMGVPAVGWGRGSAPARCVGLALRGVPDDWAHLGARSLAALRLACPPVAGLPGASWLSCGGEALCPALCQGLGLGCWHAPALVTFGLGGAWPC